MLLAEINGHGIQEVRDNEDYLTSTVFSHLRYLPPAILWNDLFGRVKGMPLAGVEKSLSELLADAEVRLSECSALEVRFWPKHHVLGVPDLAICFTGPSQRPFVLVIEAKLRAEKSGTGDRDQLMRYLNALGDLSFLDLGLDERSLAHAVPALLYLTSRESLPEVRDTAAMCDQTLVNRLFRAQWQDVLLAAEASLKGADGTCHMILSDVAAFLRNRGLQYFSGFGRLAIPLLNSRDGGFCPIEKSVEQGRSYNRRNRESGRRRDGGG